MTISRANGKGHNISQALKIHDMAYNLLMKGFGTRFKTYRRTPLLQLQPVDLPSLGVFIMRERRTPWGQANQAEPDFHCEMTMGIWGAIQAETQEQNKIYEIEKWMHEADEILLSNPKFVMETEGIQSMDRRTEYSKQGETTLVEVRVEMVIPFYADFPPLVEDILEKVVVDTQYPDKEHADSGTPQIHRVYEIETE
jgi:hypothetical protein